MTDQGSRTPDIRLLPAAPVLTYIASYIYLAYYHGGLSVFNTIVHEGGEYTLLQTLFYASHFLGHVPVATAVALVFTGTLLSMTDLKGVPPPPKGRIILYSVFILLLLLSSILLSLAVFGREDTLSFILQQKQAVKIYEQGGSWNLHLPSTLLLLFMIPPYIWISKLIFGRPVNPGTAGAWYILAGLLLIVLVTFLVNDSVCDSLVSIMRNPRYHAHSVRELMTFPVIYFPVPLYLILKMEKGRARLSDTLRENHLKYLVVVFMIVFIIALSCQSYISLSAGVSDMAQKPAFAKGGSLGIPYLLASHYFEHFLDSIYFALLCLLLFRYKKVSEKSGLFRGRNDLTAGNMEDDREG